MDGSSDETLVSLPNGSSMHALTCEGVGWLMYMPQVDDPGFSSRNPEYAGPPDATISYTLGNGQVDEYPAEWAIPVDLVREALLHFLRTGEPPAFITWHNDGSKFSIPDAVA